MILYIELAWKQDCEYYILKLLCQFELSFSEENIRQAVGGTRQSAGAVTSDCRKMQRTKSVEWLSEDAADPLSGVEIIQYYSLAPSGFTEAVPAVILMAMQPANCESTRPATTSTSHSVQQQLCLYIVNQPFKGLATFTWLKNAIFLDVTLCGSCKNWRFGEM
jgi:hypothetical protein